MKYEFTILCDINPESLDKMVDKLITVSKPFAGAVAYREITDIKDYEKGE